MSFHECVKLEEESKAILLPDLQEWAKEGTLKFFDKSGDDCYEIHKYGDCELVSCETGKLVRVELKCERVDKHGNLFLETWSNRSKYRAGWMKTTLADFLVYHFLEDGKAYWIDMHKLKDWFFRKHPTPGHPQLDLYPERLTRADQPNDTWGRCVPIQDISREVEIKWTTRYPQMETVEQGQ